MRILLGLAAIFAGVCLCLSISLWFWLGLGLLIWGLMQMPSEEECQDQVRPIGYRTGPRITIWTDAARKCGTTHGFGECSGMDCRL